MINFFLNSFADKQQVAEKQSFDNEKNELAEQVHKIALDWFVDSSEVLFVGKGGDLFATDFAPADGEKIVKPEGAIIGFMENRETNESVTYYLFPDRMLAHVPANYPEIINSLDKPSLAAYNFFFRKVVNDYSISLKKYGDVIKDIEHIDDLKNSLILKYSTLVFMHDNIVEDKKRATMLDEKTVQWWG